MPALSQWMIRIALIYLMLGFSLGMALLFAKVQWLSSEIWRYHPIHLECVQVGWLFHLALGVAYWIFPRMQRVERPRSTIAWISFACLNLGIALYSWGSLSSFKTVLLLARFIECLALFLFVIHLWPRIKAFSSE